MRTRSYIPGSAALAAVLALLAILGAYAILSAGMNVLGKITAERTAPQPRLLSATVSNGYTRLVLDAPEEPIAVYVQTAYSTYINATNMTAVWRNGTLLVLLPGEHRNGTLIVIDPDGAYTLTFQATPATTATTGVPSGYPFGGLVYTTTFVEPFYQTRGVTLLFKILETYRGPYYYVNTSNGWLRLTGYMVFSPAPNYTCIFLTPGPWTPFGFGYPIMVCHRRMLYSGTVEVTGTLMLKELYDRVFSRWLRSHHWVIRLGEPGKIGDYSDVANAVTDYILGEPKPSVHIERTVTGAVESVYYSGLTSTVFKAFLNLPYQAVAKPALITWKEYSPDTDVYLIKGTPPISSTTPWFFTFVVVHSGSCSVEYGGEVYTQKVTPATVLVNNVVCILRDVDFSSVILDYGYSWETVEEPFAVIDCYAPAKLVCNGIVEVVYSFDWWLSLGYKPVETRLYDAGAVAFDINSFPYVVESLVSRGMCTPIVVTYEGVYGATVNCYTGLPGVAALYVYYIPWYVDRNNPGIVPFDLPGAVELPFVRVVSTSPGAAVSS